MRLLQLFVLEQFPIVTRFALNKVFQQAIEEVKAFSSDHSHHCTSLVSWLLAWLCLLGYWIIGTYFMMWWALYNNLINVKAWLYTLVLCFAFDVFIYKTMEVFVIHFLVFDTVKVRLGVLCGLSMECDHYSSCSTHWELLN
jgi:hypothetical protein